MLALLFQDKNHIGDRFGAKKKEVDISFIPVQLCLWQCH